MGSSPVGGGVSRPGPGWNAHPQRQHLQQVSSGGTLRKGGRGRTVAEYRLPGNKLRLGGGHKASGERTSGLRQGGRIWYVTVALLVGGEAAGGRGPRQTTRVFCVC